MRVVTARSLRWAGLAAALVSRIALAQEPPATPTPTAEPAVSPVPADGHGATGTVSGAGDECVQCAENARRTLLDLRAITDAATRQPFGVVANAIARRMDLEHDQKIRERGCGNLIGTKAYRSETTPRDVQATDCTIFVVNVLRETFRSQGKLDQYERVMARARAGSPNGLRGTEVIKALQAELNWTAVFWAPDANTNDAGGEHKYAAYVARTKGTYYKIPVDVSKQVVGYRPEDSSKQPNLTNLQKLKKLPFGVLAAKGGMHMSLILDGKVYEVHWSDGCESMRLIEDTELEKWGWNSGVIAGPKAEVDAAWGSR